MSNGPYSAMLAHDICFYPTSSPQADGQFLIRGNKFEFRVFLFPSVTWWLTETRRWEWYSPPVELTLSSSQKVTVMRECGSHRCSHLSDLGSPDIGRGKGKWSQMIGGGDPKRKWGSLPLNGSKYKKREFLGKSRGRRTIAILLRAKDKKTNWDMEDS